MDFVEELKTDIYKNKKDISFPILGNEFTENLWKRIDNIYALAKFEHIYFYNVLNNSKCIITNQRIIIDREEEMITVFWKDTKQITIKNNELLFELLICEKTIKITSSEIDKLDLSKYKKLTVIFNNYRKYIQDEGNIELENKQINSKFYFSKSTAINIPTETNSEEIYFNPEEDIQSFKYNEEINKIYRFIGLGKYNLSLELSYKIIKTYLDDEDMFDSTYSDNLSIVILISTFYKSLLEIARSGDKSYKDKYIIDAIDETHKYLKYYHAELKHFEENCVSFLNEKNNLLENEKFIIKMLAQNGFSNSKVQNKIISKSFDQYSLNNIINQIISITEIILENISIILEFYLCLEIFYESKNKFFKNRDLVLKNLKNEELLSTALTDLYENYDENLIEAEYNTLAKSKKQFLGVFDSLVGRYNTSIMCFELNHLPGFIKFPHGHPQVDTLYVQHTTKANIYLPYESATEILFNEKIDEFVRVMQCLGATEINLEELDSLDSNQRNQIKIDASVEGKSKFVEGKAEGNINNDNDEKYSSKNKSKKYFTFEPIKKPYLPNDLYWFHIDSRWRSLAEMRLDGNTLQYEEYLSSEEISSTSKGLNIKAKIQFNTLLNKGEVKTDVSRDSVTETKQDKVCKIKVRFKDIRELYSD